MKAHLFFLFIVLIPFSLWAQSNYPTIRISEDIELIKLSEKAYVHVSVSEIDGFGKVSSNGLILAGTGEAFLFDTPVTNSQTETLVKWIADSLKSTVSTFVPNHWHEDCLGGLNYLHSKGVKSYANQRTIDLAKEHGKPVPQNGFTDSLHLSFYDENAYCYYLGEGHSTDNIVVWIPSEKILFGGCMVKDVHSKGLGNLSDAKLEEWPETIQKVIEKFPEAQIVIPGHGKIGGKEILQHTKELLQPYKMNTALLIIDIQNDYFEGGANPLVGSSEASLNAQRLLEYYRKKSLPVIHIQHLSVRAGSTFFIPDTKGAEIHQNVLPQNGEKVIVKNYPNSFRETNLLEYLQSERISGLVICGMMTHMCVDATVRAARDFGFSCTLIADACATKDLEIKDETVAAKEVQKSFLAALSYFYATVLTAQEYLEKENLENL